jgi:hypothetical protein
MGGVPDPQLDVIDAVQRHEVPGGGGRLSDRLLSCHLCLLDHVTAAACRAMAAIDSSVQLMKNPPTTSITSAIEPAR